jgi:hypothetical protein
MGVVVTTARNTEIFWIPLALRPAPTPPLCSPVPLMSLPIPPLCPPVLPVCLGSPLCPPVPLVSLRVSSCVLVSLVVYDSAARCRCAPFSWCLGVRCPLALYYSLAVAHVCVHVHIAVATNKWLRWGLDPPAILKIFL